VVKNSPPFINHRDTARPFGRNQIAVRPKIQKYFSPRRKGRKEKIKKFLSKKQETPNS
jgi:hypothetical protein